MLRVNCIQLVQPPLPRRLDRRLCESESTSRLVRRCKISGSGSEVRPRSRKVRSVISSSASSPVSSSSSASVTTVDFGGVVGGASAAAEAISSPKSFSSLFSLPLLFPVFLSTRSAPQRLSPPPFSLLLHTGKVGGKARLARSPALLSLEAAAPPRVLS